MVVDPVTLPARIEAGAKGGPRFNTAVFTTVSGSEYRNGMMPRPMGRWTISLGYRETSAEANDFDTAVAMFYAARGRLYGFLFKDWGDYSASEQTLAPVAGEAGVFQLQKVYATGSRSFARKITRPRNGTVVIKNSGVVVAATVDYTTGKVTPAAGDESSLTASFEFYVPVRFDRDELDIDTFIDKLKNLPTIDLVEILE